VIENHPLAKHTSWRIGGAARYYDEVSDPEALRAALQWAREQALPTFVLGGGTNLLVREAGFAGLVIRYTAREWRIEEQGDSALLTVQAGAAMAGMVRRVSAQGWGGLEWAEGLPGTLGGAVFGNAGCYGGDIAGVLRRAWLLVGGEVQTWPVERLQYGYRTSILKAQRNNGQQPDTADRIILAAELQLARADADALAEKMAQIAATRKAKTPWGSSCGSVFKNPPDHSAGYLIEQAGLKGRRIGGAQISEKHANYIVNTGGARSSDILQLIDLAHTRVHEMSGIAMELEVQIL
jgi:UDP-N-acetylmuramate dehydrogenase